MARLTANTIVVDPETGMPVVLVEGDELPDWATGQIPTPS